MNINSKLFGAIALVAGTTIGAVTLALPVILADLGIVVSLLMYVVVWLMMWIAALLTLEVSLTLPKNTSFISMASYTLGPIGEWVTWGCFLSLLYALLTFYLSGILDVFDSFLIVSPQLSIFCWVFFVGVLLYFGSRWIDVANRYITAGLIVSFFMLFVLLLPHCSLPSKIVMPQARHILPAIGVLITAFGYQVVIPSMKDYLEGDIKKCRAAIFWGSLVPLVIYALWTGLLMGLAPLDKLSQAHQTPVNYLHGLEVYSAGEWLSVESFIVFSIASSFLGISLGLYDFIKDGLNTHRINITKLGLIILTLGPPFTFVLTTPQIFFIALKYAVILVVVLNLIIPALMSMKLHYVLKEKTMLTTQVAKGFQVIILIFALISLIHPI